MPEINLKSESFFSKLAFVASLVFLVSSTFSSALMEISFGVALVAWFLARAAERPAFPFEKKMFVALTGYVFLSVISVFWSEFPNQSLRGILKVLQHAAVFWITAETLATGNRCEIAYRVLALVFVFLGLNGIWQYVTGFDLVRHFALEQASSGPRVSASFKNYGLLSSFVISFWPLIFSRIERWEPKAERAADLLGAPLGLLLLFWTRARAAWIAFLGGLVFYWWVLKKRLRVVILAVVALAAILVLPRAMVIHRDAEGKEQSLVERFYLWERALQVIQAKPLTGTGINTYAVAHQKYDQRQSWRVRDYYAHNGYLQMAAETGLPSLGFFLAFVFFYFREAFRTFGRLPEGHDQRVLAGILTGIVNFLLLALADTKLHNPHAVLPFWFLLGWGIAYRKSVSKSVSD
jgi:putative inorganic carbon (HCO3(-)) transporter